MDVIAQGMASLDGNRIAPEIIKFCKCEPEVALLYSPTSCILNNGEYSYSTEFLYTNLSFSGYKLGFRSEKQLASGDFGEVKVLFLPDVRNIRLDALAGLRKFATHGGKIIVYGDCLKQDEFGRPLEIAGLPLTVLPKLNGQALIDKLSAMIADKVELPVAVSVPEKGNEGVLWKTAVCGDEMLINLVNYNFKSRRIKLTVAAGHHLTNLVSGQAMPLEFELKPLHPLLFRIIK